MRSSCSHCNLTALRHSWLRSRRKLPRPPNTFNAGADISDIYGAGENSNGGVGNRLTHNLSNSNISSIGNTLANGGNTNANLENNGGLLELNLSGSTGTLNQNLSTNSSSNVFGSTNNLALDSNSKSNALNNVILLSDKRYYLFGNNGTNTNNFKNGTSKSTANSSNNTLPPLNGILNAYPL